MPCSHPLGLGLRVPLILNVLTAPAERIQLLLQSQDEVILNLREESLTLDRQSRRRSASSSELPPQPPSTDSEQNDRPLENKSNNSHSGNTDERNSKSSEGGEDEGEDDDEPRSIIVPYAYLPYTDAKDCLQRLVEKEGRRSLWRGYALESARFVLQARIEAIMQRRQIFSSWFDLRRWVNVTTESWAGSATWILGAAIEGTMRSAVALVIVYPLATLHAKMTTDVIRRTNPVKKLTIAATQDSQKTHDEQQDDSIWLVEHEDGQEENEHSGEVKPPMTRTESSSSSSSRLSYKYQDAKVVLRTSLDSCEGYLGLYKGFSTVLISTFVSRLGFLALHRIVSPWRLVQTSRPSVGTFLFVFGATSVINLALYPLGTVCHRRMIAAPGRYSSSWDAAKRIVDKQGWKALFKGCETVMVRSAVVAVLGCILH